MPDTPIDYQEKRRAELAAILDSVPAEERADLKRYGDLLNHASFIHADDWAATNGNLGIAYRKEDEARAVRSAALKRAPSLLGAYVDMSAKQFIGGAIT